MQNSSIYVVIVLYKVGLEESTAYRTLIKANGITEFLVYDNSPEADTKRAEYPATATYIHDAENSGLSKAYNLAAQKAKAFGKDHLLILDQDTHFAADAWKKYKEQTQFNGIVAPIVQTKQGMILSPVKIRGIRKRILSDVEPGDYSLYDFAVINSGCLVPISLFEQCGGYSEKVNLDFSDFQFQIRARKVSLSFRLIDTCAIQDFSNECRDANKLLSRYARYLFCAKNFETDTFSCKAKHDLEVALHTLSLTLRTRSMSFIRLFITRYLF